MKLFLISIFVITEVTVSSIQENEWAKCIPWVILITDEDGKESSKISWMEFVFLCPQGKNIFSTFWLLICVSPDFIFNRFHQNNVASRISEYCCIKSRTASSRARKLWRRVRSTVEYLLSLLGE